uniref:Uncharacterized protein n=1 Tax=Haemonchus contortus TaxID=6289 RepID=A0A7I5E9E9_HAECO
MVITGAAVAILVSVLSFTVGSGELICQHGKNSKIQPRQIKEGHACFIRVEHPCTNTPVVTFGTTRMNRQKDSDYCILKPPMCFCTRSHCNGHYGEILKLWEESERQMNFDSSSESTYNCMIRWLKLKMEQEKKARPEGGFIAPHKAQSITLAERFLRKIFKKNFHYDYEDLSATFATAAPHQSTLRHIGRRNTNSPLEPSDAVHPEGGTEHSTPQNKVRFQRKRAAPRNRDNEMRRIGRPGVEEDTLEPESDATEPGFSEEDTLEPESDATEPGFSEEDTLEPESEATEPGASAEDTLEPESEATEPGSSERTTLELGPETSESGNSGRTTLELEPEETSGSGNSGRTTVEPGHETIESETSETDRLEPLLNGTIVANQTNGTEISGGIGPGLFGYKRTTIEPSDNTIEEATEPSGIEGEGRTTLETSETHEEDGSETSTSDTDISNELTSTKETDVDPHALEQSSGDYQNPEASKEKDDHFWLAFFILAIIAAILILIIMPILFVIAIRKYGRLKQLQSQSQSQ